MATATNLSQLRAEYARLRRNSGIGATRAEWNDAVANLLAARGIAEADATPSDWVEAARDARTTCERCRGTGTYSWGGTVNGKPVHSGDCYQCEGRGTQGQDDYRRNYGYIRHAIVSACR